MPMKSALFTLFLNLCFALKVSADTFVVDNTVDPGDGVCGAPGCTLREAIDSANANPGADIINFSIPGTGVHTITPTSALPDITETVTIDGYTQPGALENTLAVGNNAVLLIELNGTSAGPLADGIVVSIDGCLIRGLVINRFAGSGIFLFGASATGNIVEGNFIGTNAAGTIDLGNDNDGVTMTNSSNNTIGGTSAGARNIISANDNGVAITGDLASGNQIMGNYIGTDVTGTIELGNSENDVAIAAPGNTIGGMTAGAGNVLSGSNAGIQIGGSGAVGNQVQGNRIGTDATGTLPLPNIVGVLLITSDTLIGGPGSAGNIIVSNGAIFAER